MSPARWGHQLRPPLVGGPHADHDGGGRDCRVVLARCLAAHSSHEEAFAQYTEARYERCRLVVESSVQIGEYEMDPSRHPDFDHAGLTQHVLETMVQPM
ncbi:hypothetical protein [Streptomyces sp. RTGN2]|uniref:hypothetical protein n=1 Tax=Streptomyces sp. RTGN2 TaxID=3016525 RepID=UPI0025544306|nr:hypothetical protein [Streptomyces sp. RTGN2]